MIRIAQASSSETFSKYGTAPNQRRTGATAVKPEGNLDGELNVVPWYGPWECVYRPLDEKVAEFIAAFMLSAVSNGSHIGYSWSGNTGVFDACQKMTIPNPAMITAMVNCDCASLVGAAVYFSGIKADGLRTLCTWQMEDILGKTNAFSKLTTKELCENGKGVRRGDILWKTGHTAVALDSDTSYLRVSLSDAGLVFTDANGKLSGKYPSNVNLDGLLYFQKFSFKGTSISAGTPGTRATQLSRSVGKAGYKIIVPRLASVSNSALCNVEPFIGGGNEKTLYVNFYRASGGSGSIDCEVVVVYVRDQVCAP